MSIVAAVVGIVGAGYSAYSTEKAAGQGRDDRRKNAADILAENQEQARRLKKQQDQTISLARARAGASGIAADGSVEGYINEMQKNFDLERNWLSKSGLRNAANQKRAGSLEYQTGRANAWGTLFAGVGSAAALGGSKKPVGGIK